MATTTVFLHGKFHGWRSLVGYSPWGRKESDTMITVSWPSTQAKFQEHLSLYIILKITWNIFEEENKKPL